ncbi:Sec-independent protein translocase subunit TatB [Rosenbergiella sp. S61]|uniref:Sec-independent protein translocase protein TatB n=1 Tax=Rosenbergiella gaditana TaxID=2726987 RepID=A0ABS5SYK8_9GAMM|nr:Sec-independent protein translocase subunit TatB [Rosenbergiella gaditana]
MFDIGFSELLLVFVIGLVVLGPERLPVAVKTVVGWIRAIRSLAANVQHELAQELKLQELQDSVKKVEEAGKGVLSPELKESIEELRKTAESVKQTYHESIDIERSEDVASHTDSVEKAKTSESLQAATKVTEPTGVTSRLVTPEDEQAAATAKPTSPPETTQGVVKEATPSTSEDKS